MEKKLTDKSVEKKDDARLQALAEIAGRQRQLKQKRNNLRNIFIGILSLFLLSLITFGIFSLFSEKKHTVTFYVNSEIVRRVEISNGGVINENDIPEDPQEPENMEFIGWYTNQTAEGERFDFDSPIRNNLNLYAGFIPTSVTLKVYLNDGTNNYYTITGRYNQLTNVLNQNFLNENLSDDYKDEVNFTLLGFDKALDAETPTYTRYQTVPLYEGSLYAIWEGKEVDIRITSADARYWNGESFPDQIIVSHYGSKIIVNTSVYSNIYQEGTGAGVEGVWLEVPGDMPVLYKNGEEIIVTYDMVLRLAFKDEFNTLTIAYNNNQDPIEIHYGYGREIPLRADVTMDNYRLVGYSDGSNTVLPGDKVIISGEVAYTAVWMNNVYTITLANDANFRGTSEIFLKYADGFYSNVNASPLDAINSIVAPLKDRHDFIGYFTEVDGQGLEVINSVGDILLTDFTLFTSNTTLYAYFEATTFTVTIENNEYGTIHPLGISPINDNEYLVGVGEGFRFTITLNEAYTQNYIRLLVELRKQNASIDKISAGNITASTRFELSNISEAATITVPELPVNVYRIIWRNSDNKNTLLKDSNYEHGSTVEYDLPHPTKEGTAEISYEFAGWSPEFQDIALENRTYIAQYTNLITVPTNIPDLTYNGNPQSVNINTLYYTITSASYTNVGLYTATATLKDNEYFWNNAAKDQLDIELDWRIVPQELSAPELSVGTSLIYNGSTRKLADHLLNFNADILRVSGGDEKKVGNYVAIISIKPEKLGNYVWADDVELQGGNVQIDWEITPAPLTITANNKSMFYGYPRPSIDYKLEGLMAGDNESTALTGGTIQLTTTATSSSLPGDYPITFVNSEGITSENYELQFVDGNLEIKYNEHILVPTLDQMQFTYTSNTITPSFVYFNEYMMEIEAGSETSGRYAGTYTITINLKGNNLWGMDASNPSEYRGTNNPVVLTWIILPAKLQVTANDKTIIYGENLPKFDVVFSGWLGGDNEFNSTTNVIEGGAFNENAFDFNILGYAGNAGSYDIEISANEATSQNYEFEFVSGKLTVQHIVYDKPTINGQLVYNGQMQNLTSVLLGFNASSMGIVGNLKTDANVNNLGEVVEQYEATISLLDKDNYRWRNEDNDNDTDDIIISWKIEKTNLLVKPVDITVIRGASSYPQLTLSYNGFMVGDDESNSITGEFAVSTNAILGLEGDYVITLAVGSAQSKNYKFDMQNGKFVVTTNQTVTMPKVIDSPFVYLGQVITPVLENFNADIMYIVEDESDLSATDAGNYRICIALNDEGNKWSNGSSAPIYVDWEILPAPLIVKADDITIYYGESYELDYIVIGLRAGDDMPALNVELPDSMPNYVGSHSINFINPSPVGVVGNYNIQWVAGVLEILSPVVQAPFLTRDEFVYSAQEVNIASYFNVPLNENIFSIRELGSVDLKATNVGGYTIYLKLNENYTWASGVELDNNDELVISWQIIPAELIIAANETVLKYKDEIPTEFGYTIEGWQGGENESLLTGVFAFSTNVGTGFPVNVGDYIITMQRGSVNQLNNYIYNFKPANLIIEKLVLVVPTAPQTVYYYSGFEQQLILTGFDSGTMSVVGDKQTNANVDDMGEVITPYIAIISLVDANNYTWPQDAELSAQGHIEIEWIMNKADLFIRANSMTIEYKTISPWPPVFTLTYSGFKENGDNELNAIIGEIIIETNATFDSPVGNSYYIRPNITNATSTNYKFKTIDGVLTIVPQKLVKPTAEITQFIFDNTEKTLDLQNFDEETMTVFNNIYINADNYTAVIRLDDATNYNWTDGTIADIEIPWEILVRLVKKPVVEGTLIYNGMEQSPDILEDAFYTISGNVGVEAGEYTATISFIHNTRPDGKPNVIWEEDGETFNLNLKWYIEKFEPLFEQAGSYDYYYGQLLEYLNNILANEQTTGPLADGSIGVIEGEFAFVSPTLKPYIHTTTANVTFTPANKNNYHVMTYSLNITVTQLIITFESNGGSPVSPIYGEWQQEYNEPVSPTRAGYNFAGWFEDDGIFGVAVTWPYLLLNHKTFYARWELKILTVSFFTGMPSGTASVQFPNDSSAIVIPDKEFSYYEDTPPVYSFNLNDPLDDFTNSDGFRLFERATGRRVIGLQINGAGEVYTSTITVTDDIVLHFVFASTADIVTIDYKGGSLTGIGAGLADDVFRGRGTHLDIKPVKMQFYYLLGYVPEEDNPAGTDVSWSTEGLGTTIRLYQREDLINVDNFYVTEGQRRFYAIWAPITVQFSYNNNGGTGQASPANNSAPFGTNNFLLADKGTLNRTHYTYEGWTKSTEVNNSREQSNILHFGEAQRVVDLNNAFLLDILNNFETYTYQIEDEVMYVTLYACWKRNVITISFNYSPGTGAPSQSSDFFSGEVVTNIISDSRFRPSSSSRTGYTLEGWSLSLGGARLTGSWTVPVNDITLYAYWEAITTTVTLNLQGGSVGGSTNPVVVYVKYDSSPTFPIPTRTGYNSLGYWTSSSGGTRVVNPLGTLSSPPWKYTNANMTLYARWDGISYTITLNPNGGSVRPSTVLVKFGSNYSLPTPSRSNYDFLGWRYNSSPFPSSGVYNVPNNITVVASWQRRTCPTCGSTSHTSTQYYQDCWYCDSWVDCAGYGSSCNCCGHGYRDPRDCSTCNPECPDCGSNSHYGCCGHGYSNSRDCPICNPPSCSHSNTYPYYCPGCGNTLYTCLSCYEVLGSHDAYCVNG